MKIMGVDEKRLQLTLFWQLSLFREMESQLFVLFIPWCKKNLLVTNIRILIYCDSFLIQVWITYKDSNYKETKKIKFIDDIQ